MILGNSQEIQNAVRTMFDRETGRRVVFVAYVGADAVTYLPRSSGIEVYCSVAIPGTNPSSLRELRNKGVLLKRVDSLHSKVYWSEHNGVVITSANLSHNGLSGQGNYEVGVFLPSHEFDANAYEASLEVQDLTNSDIDALEREYNLYRLKNRDKKAARKNPGKHTSRVPTFIEWSKETGADWKLWGWVEEADLPRDVKTEFTGQYPESYYDFIQTESADTFQFGDWVLSFKENYHKNELRNLSDFYWFIPEFRFHSKQKNQAENPYSWVSRSEELPRNMPIPFEISGTFEETFSEVYVEFFQSGRKIYLSKARPSNSFISALRERLGG